MIENFEHKGIWWLPEDEDNKLDGTLIFTPEGGSLLELSGSFQKIEDVMKVSKWDIILGFTVTGKQVTLLDNLSLGTKLHFPGMPTSSIKSSFIFIGGHFSNTEDILFKSMSIRYSLLNEWVNVSGFKLSDSWEKKYFRLEYELPQSHSAEVDNHFTISIQFRVTRPVAPRIQALIRQETELKIDSPEKRHFDSFQKISHYIQNFLSLATLEPNYPVSIRGEIESDSRAFVEVYFQSLSYTPYKQRDLNPYDMLFTFHDIRNNFEAFLRGWLQKAELLEPVYNLYFGTLYSPRMYIEHRFLSMCQAVEAYHRRIAEGKYQSDEEFLNHVYPKLIKALPDEIDKYFKESIKIRLKYLNEYSLRKRLKAILKNHAGVVSEVIRDINGFIDRVVTTRNFFTHYDKRPGKGSISGEILFMTTERLKFLMEVCFLAELGFMPDQIVHLIKRTQRYNYVKSRKNT